MEIQKYFDMLGHKAKDKITGKHGFITSVGFDLYGCIQVVLHCPAAEKTGLTAAQEEEQMWLDVCRVELTGGERAIEPPDFVDRPHVSEGKRGPAMKPEMSRVPLP